MIQRKQSLFLLLTGIVIIISIFNSFIDFISEKGIISVYAFSIHDNNSGLLDEQVSILTLGATLIIIALINISAIFLYTKRPLQIRIIRYALLLKIAILAILGYYTYLLSSTTDYISFSISPQIGSVLLVISILLDWLSISAIKKDENLIRSIDRIR